MKVQQIYKDSYLNGGNVDNDDSYIHPDMIIQLKSDKQLLYFRPRRLSFYEK